MHSDSAADLDSVNDRGFPVHNSSTSGFYVSSSVRAVQLLTRGGSDWIVGLPWYAQCTARSNSDRDTDTQASHPIATPHWLLSTVLCTTSFTKVSSDFTGTILVSGQASGKQAEVTITKSPENGAIPNLDASLLPLFSAKGCCPCAQYHSLICADSRLPQASPLSF